MTAEERRPFRRALRLSAESCEQQCAYFVTVCTHEKQCLLSIVDGRSVKLTKRGEMVRTTWWALPDKFPAFALDECMVMPNDMHGIPCFVGAGLAPPSWSVRTATGYSLMDVMRAFKSSSTMQVNREFRTPGCRCGNEAISITSSGMPRIWGITSAISWRTP
jgi:putative transposase